MVVGSRAGSSAAVGSTPFHGINVLCAQITDAFLELHLDRVQRDSAALLSRTVQPVHHFRSSSVPGPDAASHLLASSACAAGRMPKKV